MVIKTTTFYRKECHLFSYASHVLHSLLIVLVKGQGNQEKQYDEESDHSNKAVRKTPEIESGHKVSEEVK